MRGEGWRKTEVSSSVLGQCHLAGLVRTTVASSMLGQGHPAGIGGAREEVIRRELGRSWRRHLLGSRSTGELQHLPQATYLDLNRKKHIGYLIPFGWFTI
jgi:hypothetical protein